MKAPKSKKGRHADPRSSPFDCLNPDLYFYPPGSLFIIAVAAGV